MKLLVLFFLLCLTCCTHQQVSATNYGKRRRKQKLVKTIIIKGSGDTTFTLEPLTFDENNNPTTANVFLEALVRVRSVGKLRLDAVQFVNLAEGTIQGNSTWTARNGDAFDATYVGTSTTSGDAASGNLSYEATFTITGGTGRFHGATGSFESGGTANLVQGTGTTFLDGSLTKGIPIWGSGSNPTFTIEPLTLDENGDLATANVKVVGPLWLERLGKVNLETEQFVNIAEGTIEGKSTWTTTRRNGEAFFADFTGTSMPTDASGSRFSYELSYTITGGTGRFLGARGSFQSVGDSDIAAGTGVQSVDGVLTPAIPIKGSGTNTFTLEPLTFDENNNIVTANVRFVGLLHLDRLGAVEIEALQFANIPEGTLEGNSTWTNRKGDQFFASYAGTSTQPDANGVLTYQVTFTITGGTGRFTAASGSFEGSGIGDLAQGTGTTVVDGFLRN